MLLVVVSAVYTNTGFLPLLLEISSAGYGGFDSGCEFLRASKESETTTNAQQVDERAVSTAAMLDDLVWVMNVVPLIKDDIDEQFQEDALDENIDIDA
ncbi:hypothetical protein TSUD_219600 [Trifolium subterraneum]|uniref:Uncharacterized protein n=1 Tax=Trifolium subterraneum TaxID=3900 RepID=A0A2Z6P8K8_TRISU|nr:hypothetical protein TSUD_219600 [Trifolium subterraneum]